MHPRQSGGRESRQGAVLCKCEADPPGDLWVFRETTVSVGKWNEGRNSRKGLLWGSLRDALVFVSHW